MTPVAPGGDLSYFFFCIFTPVGVSQPDRDSVFTHFSTFTALLQACGHSSVQQREDSEGFRGAFVSQRSEGLGIKGVNRRCSIKRR